MPKYYIQPLDITLVTAHDYPPIPMRYLDWSCTDTNYDGAPDAGPQLIGQGRTEQFSINDYFEQRDNIEENKLENMLSDAQYHFDTATEIKEKRTAKLYLDFVKTLIDWYNKHNSKHPTGE